MTKTITRTDLDEIRKRELIVQELLAEKQDLLHLRAVNYDAERVQTSSLKTLDDVYLKIEQQEAKIDAAVDALYAVKAKYETLIGGLDAVEGLIIKKRYFRSLSWPEIASEVGYAIQHVYRLHGRALLNLEKMRVNESKNCGIM